MRMYFIALVVPEELNRLVLVFKEYMREHYGCKAALRSPAHITIIPPFWMDEELEVHLAEKINEVAKDLDPFFLQHNGFSSFPSKTIFIGVKSNALLDQLHKEVNSFFRSHPDFRMKFDDRPFHPHVTVATRDLTKRSYQEAWQYFKEKKFQKEWMCSSISLLALSETGWETLHVSQFGS